MKKSSVIGALIAVHFFLVGMPASAQANLASVGGIPSPQIAASYGKLPLRFEPNRGQTDARVQFVSRGAGYTIFLSPTSTTFALLRNSTASDVVRMDLLGSD